MVPRSGRLIAMILFIAVTLPTLWAKEKPHPDWTDGTLIGFHEVSSGQSCSENGSVKSENSDRASYSSGSNCTNITSRIYTIRVGESTYSVRRVLKLWEPGASKSSLDGQMPGAHFETWLEGNRLHIRIGKHESLFVVVEAGRNP
jgi:hypothetical protein